MSLDIPESRNQMSNYLPIKYGASIQFLSQRGPKAKASFMLYENIFSYKK